MICNNIATHCCTLHVTLTVLCPCLMLILLNLVMLVDAGCSVMFSHSLCKKMVLIPDVQRMSGLDERGSPPDAFQRTLSPGGAGPGAAQTSIGGAGCASTAPSHCRLHRCRLVDPLGQPWLQMFQYFCQSFSTWWEIAGVSICVNHFQHVSKDFGRKYSDIR